MDVNWKQKLTSRKFWAAVAQFVTMMIIALGGQREVATQVTALIMAGAAVVAYIIGEGLADAAHVEEGEVYVLDTDEPESEEPADR